MHCNTKFTNSPFDCLLFFSKCTVFTKRRLRCAFVNKNSITIETPVPYTKHNPDSNDIVEPSNTLLKTFTMTATILFSQNSITNFQTTTRSMIVFWPSRALNDHPSIKVQSQSEHSSPEEVSDNGRTTYFVNGISNSSCQSTMNIYFLATGWFE